MKSSKMAGLGSTEMSPGERLWRRAKPLRVSVRIRPAAVAGLLAAAGVVVQMVSALINASLAQDTKAWKIGLVRLWPVLASRSSWRS